jgi:hypothetical protein
MNFLRCITRYLKAWPDSRHFGAVVTLINQLFITLLAVYLLLLLLETIFPESVSRFLNLNYLLLAVIASGIVTTLTLKDTGNEKEGRRLTGYNIIILVCIGLGGAALIWYQTQEIGWLSYVISLAGGVLIVLLSLLIWKKDEEGKSEGEDLPDN